MKTNNDKQKVIIDTIDKYIDLCVNYFAKNKTTPESKRDENWYRDVFEINKISLLHQIEEEKSAKFDAFCDELSKIPNVNVLDGIPEIRGGLDFVQIKPYDYQTVQQVQEILSKHKFEIADETEDGEEYLIFFYPFDESN